MSGLVLLVLLQCLCCSGVPVLRFSFRPMAQWAVRVTQDQVNQRSARPRLFRVANSIVQRIAQVDLTTYDLHLDFDIGESVCSKGLEPYLDGCRFRSRKQQMEASCSSVVRVAGEFSRLQSLECMPAQSSSSESSSEEMIMLQNVQIFQQTPGITVCDGAISCAPYVL
ncbi:secreted phosphoprotein 24 isoform X2 [Hypomesus transpacificus]|uniref:secreted phosphoprotein 24 isoform X2 n=1 Tax=Hypomesus transpacificus TaxID=137520 RepID=UPI001F07B00B|nr:secreted phosphoprotein 24 isoform X2 [Hypomesus transpacificus]